MSDQRAFRRFGTRGLVLVLGVAAANVVAPAGPASAAVPGLVRISATSPSSSDDFRSVTATCPAGKALVGTDYEITGGVGEVVVDDFSPNGGAATAPTSVISGAYEEDAFAGNWDLRSYAICADR
ncbi:hypothetical protein ACIBCR_03925 [Micromonospora echinospora]|uniref:hypothetical protein n=1 Tax=Micromonospora echinospora TaxID=1877 RepID=UPI00378FE94E